MLRSPLVIAMMLVGAGSASAAVPADLAQKNDDIGYLEIGYGHDGYLTSCIRTLDEGGMVWEGADEYPTLDAALAAAEAALGDWLEELGVA